MSVQNGERLATKQDLADMYQGILPYLGGMPEMVANKFSKGDLYSTDEKMIGQWIDGKPLYQKTVLTGALQNATEKTVAHGIANIDIITYAYATVNADSGEMTIVPYAVDQSAKINNQIILTVDKTNVYYTSRYSDDKQRYTSSYCTLRYTKTTDVAISIGETTEYSTDEKVVGTWIDSKPLYQKTINFGVLPNATTREVAHNISNLGHVVDIRGTAYTSTGTFMPLPLMYPSNEVQNDTMIQVFSDKIIMKNLADRSVYSAYITLQYTKTTD